MTKKRLRGIPLHKREHGLFSTYKAGCRCEMCREAVAEYERERRKRKARGETPWTDAAPIREHLRNLMCSHSGIQDGISIKRIARLAGIGEGTIQNIIWGSHGTEPAEKVRKETADKILAIKPDSFSAIYIKHGLEEAHAVQKMLSEIYELGITPNQLGAAIDWKDPRFRLRSMKFVSATLAKKIENLHWALWRTNGAFRTICSCELPEELRQEYFEEAS